MFTSDCPVDKLVWLKEDEIQLDENGKATVEINTGLDHLVFVEGIVSFDDWESCTPIIQGDLNNIRGLLISGVGLVAIVFTPRGSNPEYANKKAKVRLWGYMPESDGEIVDSNPTANVAASKLSFSTDNNYPKFVGDGYLNSGDVYNHDLGYIPRVIYWILVDEENNEWQYEIRGEYPKGLTVAWPFYMTENQLSFGGDYKYYYRLYAS